MFFLVQNRIKTFFEKKDFLKFSNWSRSQNFHFSCVLLSREISCLSGFQRNVSRENKWKFTVSLKYFYSSFWKCWFSIHFQTYCYDQNWINSVSLEFTDRMSWDQNFHLICDCILLLYFYNKKCLRNTLTDLLFLRPVLLGRKFKACSYASSRVVLEILWQTCYFSRPNLARTQVRGCPWNTLADLLFFSAKSVLENTLADLLFFSTKVGLKLFQKKRLFKFL